MNILVKNMYYFKYFIYIYKICVKKNNIILTFNLYVGISTYFDDSFIKY